MVVFRRTHLTHDERPSGTWRPLALDEDAQEMSASISCPRCGSVGTLTNHEINALGHVSPRVRCPDDCGWDDEVVLDTWGLDTELPQ